ncbi:cation:proton antiporter [Chitiniphilus purpureus]|uniref:Cation:proton antiporter n=1 Tax=Chitiniphilus purpureus TaxID=2981137 RepID=A0ABY6DKT7_9NEIS|nr:cation:proton antiporter [Chitiniphilus sp. CD1]UXY14975.1 cation:proton antiporter [Chitiniphilus sp. CD1]
MLFAVWASLIGGLMIVMALAGSLLKRLPVSMAMLYLAVGYAIGEDGWGLLRPDPARHAMLLERLAEVAVLVSLFVAGLKLGAPLSDRRWRATLRLAVGSMLLTVALIALVACFALGLPLGAAVLLGAILAPTDPVLASDVQVEHPEDRDELRFCLTGEGGLNDGTAFPLVMLGLGLLGLHDLGDWGWRWWLRDVLWAVAGGLLIGTLLGGCIGRLVVYLRIRHREAVGLDEFLALGLIALAYGVALLCHTYGFLAVFAAGLALRRTSATERPPTEPTLPAAPPREVLEGVATTPELAGCYMRHAMLSFNEQLERIGEVALVLLLGALLAFVAPPVSAIWFVPLLFLLIRPIAVALGLAGSGMPRGRRLLTGWFGIRGVGSIYYLMFAINHGLPQPLAQELTALTLTTVATSIVLHGISVTPLMRRYQQRKPH